PSALPRTAAITGTGSSAQTYAARCPVDRAGPVDGGSCAVADSRSPSRIAWNEPKSSPAQKSGPSPDSTTARSPGSVFSRSPAAPAPPNSAGSGGLRFSGGSTGTSAPPPARVPAPRPGVPISLVASLVASLIRPHSVRRCHPASDVSRRLGLAGDTHDRRPV